MTATLQEQLAERLEFVRLSGLNAVLSPGRHCAPAVTGLPALADERALSIQWTVLDATDGTQLVPGSAFLASRGLSGRRVDLVFRPEVVEALGPPPPALLRTVRATVSLTAPTGRGADVSATRVLEAAVQVLPLRLPPLLAAFRHDDYAFASPEERRNGAALLLVPAGSPLSSVAEARAALHELLLAARALTGFHRFVAFAERVRTLVDALNAHPAKHIGLIRADAIADLGQISFTHDAAGDDELSSLILIGGAGRRLVCCVHRDLNPAGGRLDVSVGDEGAVLVPSLSTLVSEPTGRAEVAVAAPGGFDDALTSLALERPVVEATLAVPTVEVAPGWGVVMDSASPA
jgi:hypothetical protein